MFCQVFGGIHFSMQGEYMNNITKRSGLTVTLKDGTYKSIDRASLLLLRIPLMPISNSIRSRSLIPLEADQIGA